MFFYCCLRKLPEQLKGHLIVLETHSILQIAEIRSRQALKKSYWAKRPLKKKIKKDGLQLWRKAPKYYEKRHQEWDKCNKVEKARKMASSLPISRSASWLMDVPSTFINRQMDKIKLLRDPNSILQAYQAEHTLTQITISAMDWICLLKGFENIWPFLCSVYMALL